MKYLLFVLSCLLSLTAHGSDSKKLEIYIEIARTPIINGFAEEEQIICKHRISAPINEDMNKQFEFRCKTTFSGLPVKVRINLFFIKSQQPVQGENRSVLEFYTQMCLVQNYSNETSPVIISPERLFFKDSPYRVQSGVENYIATTDLDIKNLIQNLEPANFNYLSSCIERDSFCREWGDIFRASVVWEAQPRTGSSR
ncbi:MAG: hypothetical protein KDD22_02915 [Bdellovibrionales bacterium]|nr:hypothetical protein [Bdellovibrionales bacterium]